MEIAANKITGNYFLNIIEKFKLTNLESIIINLLQETPKASPGMYYIGEYNKNDAMF